MAGKAKHERFSQFKFRQPHAESGPDEKRPQVIDTVAVDFKLTRNRIIRYAIFGSDEPALVWGKIR